MTISFLFFCGEGGRPPLRRFFARNRPDNPASITLSCAVFAQNTRRPPVRAGHIPARNARPYFSEILRETSSNIAFYFVSCPFLRIFKQYLGATSCANTAPGNARFPRCRRRYRIRRRPNVRFMALRQNKRSLACPGRRTQKQLFRSETRSLPVRRPARNGQTRKTPRFFALFSRNVSKKNRRRRRLQRFRRQTNRRYPSLGIGLCNAGREKRQTPQKHRLHRYSSRYAPPASRHRNIRAI